jgi:hypothetical protein
LRHRGVGEINLEFGAGGGHFEEKNFKCKIL